MTRVLVAATEGDDAARLTARALLLSGREVIFVGGEQRLDQLVATAVIEDVSEIVLAADPEDRRRLAVELADVGLGEVVVTPVEPSAVNRDFGE